MPSTVVATLQNMCCLSSVPSAVRIYQVPVLSSEATILLVSTEYYNSWLELLS